VAEIFIGSENLENSLSCHFKIYNVIPKDCWLYAILFETLLSRLTSLIVCVVFSVPSVKYGNVFFNSAWKIARELICLYSENHFTNLHVMLEFLLHLPHSVWTLLVCVTWKVLIYAVMIPVTVMNGVTNGSESIALVQILLG